MKVLLINNLHRRRGGADVVYFNTAALLQSAGHEVHFFSISTSDMEQCQDAEFFAPSQENASALKKMRAYFYNKGAAENLQRYIDCVRPDIAHVHLIWGGLSPSILEVLRINKIPIVHTIHDYRMICPAYTFRTIKGEVCERCKGGNYYHCFLRRCSKGRLLESALMTYEMYVRNRSYTPSKLIDGFIFVSRFAELKHVEFDVRFSRKETIVLYNFWPGRPAGDAEEPTRYDSYYLFYGRLSKEKGISTLIKAFENFPSLQLWIVGDGPMKEELVAYCNAKGLENISFKGYLSGDALYTAVRQAKFVCVPSEWYENNPMTIVESYALHTPVIGARIGGIPEIVDEGQTGFGFESGGQKSLQSAIQRAESITEEEYAKMRQCAGEFAASHFSKEKHLTTLTDFYQTIINNYE